MADFVWRIGCSCGWKGPVRTVTEKTMLVHDAAYHFRMIDRPDFHQMLRMRAVVTWEHVQD